MDVVEKDKVLLHVNSAHHPEHYTLAEAPEGTIGMVIQLPPVVPAAVVKELVGHMAPDTEVLQTQVAVAAAPKSYGVVEMEAPVL